MQKMRLEKSVCRFALIPPDNLPTAVSRKELSVYTKHQKQAELSTFTNETFVFRLNLDS